MQGGLPLCEFLLTFSSSVTDLSLCCLSVYSQVAAG